MSSETENALRNIARQADAAIKAERSKSPGKSVDDICRQVLSQYRETVTLMGFTPFHLNRAIGVLNGRFKERQL